MSLPTESLLAPADLSFDFRRWTITDDEGHRVGSLRWRRRPGAALRSDLGFRDGDGTVRWWLRPAGVWGRTADEVLSGDDEALVGQVRADALVVDGDEVAWVERRRHAFYLPVWRILGEHGLVAEIRR